MSLPRSADLLRLLRSYASLGAGRIGIDGQPDHAFVRVLFLQVLHIAGAVVLLHKWTLRIKPLEHHVFALVFGKRVRFALGVGKRKIRRGAAYRWYVRSKNCGCDQ